MPPPFADTQPYSKVTILIRDQSKELTPCQLGCQGLGCLPSPQNSAKNVVVQKVDSHVSLFSAEQGKSKLVYLGLIIVLINVHPLKIRLGSLQAISFFFLHPAIVVAKKLRSSVSPVSHPTLLCTG